MESMILNMVLELWFDGGLKFNSPSAPIFSQFNKDMKALIALKMGARDLLFNPKMGFRVSGSVEIQHKIHLRPSKVIENGGRL